MFYGSEHGTNFSLFGDSSPYGLEIGLVSTGDPNTALGNLAAGSNQIVGVSLIVNPLAQTADEVELRLVMIADNGQTQLEKVFVVDVVSLSDVQWLSASNGWGDLHLDQSIQGLAIRVGGETHTKGIGLHANAELRYNLAGSYKRFTSTVGVDDEVGAAGSVIFQVWLDGQLAFDSGLLEGDSPNQSLDLDVTGVQEMRLVLDEADHGISSDHADWASPRLFFDAPQLQGRVPQFLPPAVQLMSHGVLNDSGGDGQLDPGETATLRVEVVNAGTQPVFSLIIIASPQSASGAHLVIQNPLQSLPTLHTGQSIEVDFPVSLSAGAPAPDQLLIDYLLQGENVDESFTVANSIQAAEFYLAWLGVFNDDDMDGLFDAGEEADMGLRTTNSGAYVSAAVNSHCTATGPNASFVTVLDPILSTNPLAPGAFQDVFYRVRASPSIPDGTQIELSFEVEDGTSSSQVVQALTVANPAPPRPQQLSDWTPTFVSQDWGSLHFDQSVDSNPLRVGGTTYPKGLGTHANSDVRYSLGGGYSRFQSIVGLDDEVGSGGSVRFEVWTDGNRIYQGPVVTGADAGVALDLDVTGAMELRLLCLGGGDGINSDHGDWADATVVQ